MGRLSQECVRSKKIREEESELGPCGLRELGIFLRPTGLMLVVPLWRTERKKSAALLGVVVDCSICWSTRM